MSPQSLLGWFRVERDRLEPPAPPGGAQGPVEGSWPDDPPPVRAEVILARSNRRGPRPTVTHAVGLNRLGVRVTLCPTGPALIGCTVVPGCPADVTCARCRAKLDLEATSGNHRPTAP